MNVLAAIALVILSVALALFMYRLFAGPSVADRVIALDGILVTILAGAVVGAARDDTSLPIDVVIVVALLGFIGTTIIARYIEQRGA